MANEIKVSVRLQNKNGNFDYSKNVANRSLDQANAGGGNPGTISVTTVDETVSFGDLDTPGYCYAENLAQSGSQVISLGSASGDYLIELYPNEVSLFPLESGASVHAVASEGTGSLFISAIER